MTLLPVVHDWRRLFTSLVLVLGVALGLPVCELVEVNAQSRTKLRLLDKIPEPGGPALEEDTLLPAKTQVVVLFERVELQENKSDFSTLQSRGTSHPALAQRIRNGSGTTMRLRKGGQTPVKFGQTDVSRKVYYLLARTEGGKLYESYVNTGDGDFSPGFDAVESGDMKMGPVPKEHRDSLRAALESAFSVGNSGGGGNSNSGAKKNGGSTEKQKGGTVRSEGYFQSIISFFYEDNFIIAIFFIFGVGSGSLAVWFIMGKEIEKWKKRYRSKSKDLRELRASTNKQKENIENRVNKKREKMNRKIKKKENKIKNLEKEVKRKKRKIRSLRSRKGVRGEEGTDKVEDQSLKRTAGKSERTGSSVQRSQSRDPSPQSSGDGLVQSIGRAFVKWCDDAGAAMVDRHTMFAKTLKDHIPQADLQRIFREKNAAGIVFAEDAQDAVEYWLVRADGRDFLLPQPQRSGFREVGKCFEVERRSPDELKEFLPAELQSQGGKYKLQSKGMLA